MHREDGPEPLQDPEDALGAVGSEEASPATLGTNAPGHESDTSEAVRGGDVVYGVDEGEFGDDAADVEHL